MSKYSEAQKIAALKQLDAGRKSEEIGRELGASKDTVYAWKQNYGGMSVSEAQEVKELRDENARLKELVAELALDKDALQHVIRKNGYSL
jgi:putative transposase